MYIETVWNYIYRTIKGVYWRKKRVSTIKRRCGIIGTMRMVIYGFLSVVVPDEKNLQEGTNREE